MTNLIYLFEARDWKPSFITIENILRSEIETISRLYEDIRNDPNYILKDFLVCTDDENTERLAYHDRPCIVGDKVSFLTPISMGFFDVINSFRKKARTVNFHYEFNKAKIKRS